MGNKASKPLNQNEILNVKDDDTLEDVKKSYRELLYIHKNNPDKILKIHEAYNHNISTIKLEIYNKELFSKNLNKYAKDFFLRLSSVYQIKCAPNFDDSDFNKFYTFWKTFRHYDKNIENQVLKTIKLIKSMDPRFIIIKKTSTISNAFQTVEHHQTKEVNQKEWTYFCKACNKPFNNKNTLQDHLNSKKHKSKEAGEDCIKINLKKIESDDKDDEEEKIDKLEITKIEFKSEPHFTAKSTPKDQKILNLESSFNIECEEDTLFYKNIRSNEIAKAESEDNKQNGKHSIVKNTDSQDNLTALKNNKDQSKSKEPKLLRTCNFCKKVLESRGKLILHIRNEHDQ